MKRRKLSSRQSRKVRSNPSQYGIAPVIIAGLIGLASTIGGGLLSSSQQKKEQEAALLLQQQQAQQAAESRKLWLALGGLGVIATLGAVAVWALTRDDGDEDEKKKKKA
jgi:hypothetical protein